ncbi:MAG: alpha/beta fold hydrolase [Actinomycetes bacterium]
MSLTPESRTFDVGGGLLVAAECRGAEEGPPVLLVHGGGQTRHSWGGTADVLAESGWYTVAYDQRGHGDSGRPVDRDYRSQRFAEDLISISDQVTRMAGSRPAVVGA